MVNALVYLIAHSEFHSDRIRTTNNMLGDCYAAAVVEELSKKELMALDAAVLYQDTPVTPNGHLPTSNGHQTVPDTVVVEMNGRSPATPLLFNGNGNGNGTAKN